MSFTMTEVLGRLRSGPIRQPRCQILRFSVLQTTAGPRKTKETFLDSSEMGRAPIGSSIGLSLTRRTGSLGQGSHVWISQSRPSCTAFSVHRLRCAAAFLVMEAGQKKPRARFSHCWRTLSIRQPTGQKRAAIPAGCRQGKGASWFGSDAWSVDDALSHGD